MKKAAENLWRIVSAYHGKKDAVEVLFAPPTLQASLASIKESLGSIHIGQSEKKDIELRLTRLSFAPMLTVPELREAMREICGLIITALFEAKRIEDSKYLPGR